MNILVIAPHADDEVLGVGGTIAKEVNKGAQVYVCVVTVGHASMYSEKDTATIRNECLDAHRILGIKDTVFLECPAVLLSEYPKYEINQKIADTIERISPQKVFIPHFGDIHSDHAVVAQSCMVALRPTKSAVSEIYSYETLSETEWNISHSSTSFLPTVWSDISDTLLIKTEAMNCYKSQLFPPPHARSLDNIRYLARLRGSTIGVEAAEAFSCIRLYL